MDDYHIVAVHPSTFGKNGYLGDGVNYFRFGDHFAYFPGPPGEDSVTKMAQECLAGAYTPHRFRIFHFFPNFSAVIFKAPGCWMTMMLHYRAVAVDQTEIRIWYYPAPFQTKNQSWLYRAYVDAIAVGVSFYIAKVLAEDNAINEQHQMIVRQIDRLPMLGLQEERIVWFEESYERAMKSAATPPAPIATGVVRNKDHVALITDQLPIPRAAQ
jgi:hypothetical protein